MWSLRFYYNNKLLVFIYSHLPFPVQMIVVVHYNDIQEMLWVDHNPSIDNNQWCWSCWITRQQGIVLTLGKNSSRKSFNNITPLCSSSSFSSTIIRLNTMSIILNTLAYQYSTYNSRLLSTLRFSSSSPSNLVSIIPIPEKHQKHERPKQILTAGEIT